MDFVPFYKSNEMQSISWYLEFYEFQNQRKSWISMVVEISDFHNLYKSIN